MRWPFKILAYLLALLVGFCFQVVIVVVTFNDVGVDIRKLRVVGAWIVAILCSLIWLRISLSFLKWANAPYPASSSNRNWRQERQKMLFVTRDANANSKIVKQNMKFASFLLLVANVVAAITRYNQGFSGFQLVSLPIIGISLACVAFSLVLLYLFRR